MAVSLVMTLSNVKSLPSPAELDGSVDGITGKATSETQRMQYVRPLTSLRLQFFI